MAKLAYISTRKRYRVRYRFGPKQDKLEIQCRAFDKRQKALHFLRLIDAVEEATELGRARATDIREWVRLKLLTSAEADEFFVGAFIETDTDFVKLRNLFRQRNHRFPRSLPGNTSRGKRLFSWLENEVHNLKELDKDIIENWLHHLYNEENMSQKTVYHMVTCLRIILDIAVNERMLSHNVARDAKWRQPRHADMPRRTIKDREANILFIHAENPKLAALLGGSMEVALGLGRYLGLRNQEAEMMLWEDLDLDEQVLAIPQRKKLPSGQFYEPKTFGDMPLPNELTERLRRWKVLQGSERHPCEKHRKQQVNHDFVLGGTRDKRDVCHPWPKGSIGAAFKKVRTKANLSNDVTFYGFRHRFAQHCLKPREDGGLGLDTQTVRKLMRHASITTTELYIEDLKLDRNVLKDAQF